MRCRVGVSCPFKISWCSREDRQLDGAVHPRRFPNRLSANTASGVWQTAASTDKSSFEANTGLTFKEATSSIDDQRSNQRVKRKRSLTTGGLIEDIDT